MSDTPYDPEARRDTPLALKLKERIRHDGPITVKEYMRACLYDAEHGYYRRRAAIGGAGDFITAPEISQIFGELIGLWAAVVWQQMGAPKRVHLVEFGPGRGTLMRDLLRAAHRLPDFRAALRVAMVEQNAALEQQQRALLADADVPIAWYDGIETMFAARHADGQPEPFDLIAIGNEFLDCLPREQHVRLSPGWLTRRVGLDPDERLVFCVGRPFPGAPNHGRHDKKLDALYPSATDGAIVEPSNHQWIVDDLRCKATAALFIDYGYDTTAVGDTLQAVRNHRYEDPLTSPGEADITTHVDFAAITRRAHASTSLLPDGPVTQAEFLGSLGIMERASRLMAANPSKAAQIEAGVARLMSPTGMGSRFKAIGLRSPHLPPLPGFPVVDKSHPPA